MKKSAYDLCCENNLPINILDCGVGKKYTTCPECSSGRQPKNRKLKVLRVTIDNIGIRWTCFHCGHHGYGFYEAGGRNERYVKNRNVANTVKSTGSEGIGPRIGGKVWVLHDQERVCLRFQEQRTVALQKVAHMEQGIRGKTIGNSKTVMAPAHDTRFAVPPKRSFGDDRR